MKKTFLLLWMCNLLLSCGQKNQYEILSPCVSADSQELLKNPCVRRSINHDIA